MRSSVHISYRRYGYLYRCKYIKIVLQKIRIISCVYLLSITRLRIPQRFAEWMSSGSGQEEEIKRRVLALRDADWFVFLGSNGEEVNKCAKPDQYANGKAEEIQRTRYYEEEETDTWAFAWMPVIEDFVRTSKEIGEFYMSPFINFNAYYINKSLTY